jgi:hypothetical protein
LLKYARFRQKVVEDAIGALWVDDDHFDIAAHVVPEHARGRRGQSRLEALKARVAELTTLPLNPSRPLWQFHLSRTSRPAAARSSCASITASRTASRSSP